MNQRAIYFLGGIVRFELPSEWIETRDVGATGMYFVDREGSGTLRLSLVSVRPPDDDATRAMSRAIAVNGYTMLREDLAMLTRVEDSVEDEQPIRMRTYSVMFPVDDGTIRIAIFSFTTYRSPSGVEDDETLAEIDVVERAIRDGAYSSLALPDVDVQRFSPLNESDEAWLVERRARVLGDAAVVTALDSNERLDLLESEFEASPDAERTEALGVLFGDALVAETDLEWQAVVDAYGWALCLGLPGTTVSVFPIDMIQKRIERGERIDVGVLIQQTIVSIARVVSESATVN